MKLNKLIYGAYYMCVWVCVCFTALWSYSSLKHRTPASSISFEGTLSFPLWSFLALSSVFKPFKPRLKIGFVSHLAHEEVLVNTYINAFTLSLHFGQDAKQGQVEYSYYPFSRLDAEARFKKTHSLQYCLLITREKIDVFLY